MTIPFEYTAWFESLGFDEIAFGYAGLKLLSPAELEDGQIGYSFSATGESLCGGKQGSWKAEWIAIGYDTSLGDPIILDTSNAQIMTAMHGEGSWEPYAIAKSLHAFAIALKEIKRASTGREYPAALENNPLSDEERDRILDMIRKASGDGINLEFWRLILE
jgi:hypothetical protein